MTAATLKCPGCATVHVLDKALLSKGAPNEDNEIHSGYRVECEKCHNPYMVVVTILDVATKKEKATVEVQPMPATAVSCAERDAIADKARAGAGGVGSPAVVRGQDAAAALEALGVSEETAMAAGVQVHKEAAEEAVQEALAPFYAKQAKATAKVAAGKASDGKAALARL